MCRWIAYRGEPIFLDEFVTTPHRSLLVQSQHSREAKSAVNGDGFGLGWYGARETPGVFRDVRPAWSDEELLSLAHQIRASIFFAHVRASTGTATTRANCHPFRYGRWLFMHNGAVGGWNRLRRKIEIAIPDQLFAHRQGTTDSEAVFLLMLANGLEQDALGACARTVGFIERVLRENDEHEPLRFTAAFSDGDRLYAVRHSSRGVPETLYTRRRKTGNGVLVVSEPLDDGRDDWEAVLAGGFLTLDGEAITVVPFAPGR